MKKFLGIVVLLFLTVECFAQPVPLTRFRDASGTIVDVYPSRGLPVDVGGAISVTIGSTTFTAAPVYSDETGSATLGLVDGERRLVVNVGSTTVIQPVSVDQTTPGTTNAVAGKVWDGAAFVDMPGTASGVFFIPRPYDVASTSVGTFSTVAYAMPLKSGCQVISVTLTQADKEAWFAINADPTVGNGYPFHTSVEIINLNPGDVLKFIASETIGACWIQR